MSRRFAVTLALAGTTSCAHDLAHASSGVIGCAPREIEISEVALSWSTTSWRARCRELAFRCAGVGSPSCAPEPAMAGSAADDAARASSES
ncbi:MAG: hypothetical protein IAG13_22480 [Deltaproteobacteria bacterium]|nr:hypothetical protein [Nannocystaceae bacterium]